MDNSSTHDDDVAILAAQEYLNGTPLVGEENDIIKDLMNRVLEKKVEIRGLEGQITTLKGELSTVEHQRDTHIKGAEDYEEQLEKAQAKIGELETMLAGD